MEHKRNRLELDPDALATLADGLDAIGFDTALQVLRPDYFTSPFANYDELMRILPGLEPTLAMAIRLFTLGEPVQPTALESALGPAIVEAAIICGLLRYDERHDRFDTGGFTLVTRTGQYFIVSANPYYPSFNPANAAIYMGPDSYTLANALLSRSARLPIAGAALDLCCGSGIGGLSIAVHRPDLVWTAVDREPDAIMAARVNATLNRLAERYLPVEGDLYAPIGDRRFDLVVANPPFIPVPDGLDFPVYGAGGEDGRKVLAPLLERLPAHLALGGSAVIYAEGIGRAGRLLILDDLEALFQAGWDVTVTLLAESPIEGALYTLGVMLSRLTPSRLPEIVRWRDLFRRLRADHYAKFVIDVRAGHGRLTIRRVCPSPAGGQPTQPGTRSAGGAT